jgi:hypothetical protein
MFRKEMVVAAAALVLGSFLVATDASAARRGGAGPRNHAVSAGGQKSTASRFSSPSRNGNFGMSGPYVGLKWIGNQ